MNYRPSKNFVYLMVVFYPLLVALIVGLLPEVPSFAARPIPGAQSATAITQAAFAIMGGQPIPKDPVYGQDYRWDPATRLLSMPAGMIFDEMSIKPVTVPKL